MTITEAYIIFFGKTNDIIDEEYIQEKLTEAIVKEKYRKLTKKYHPDLHIEDKEYYTNEYKKINNAYEVLKQVFTIKITKNPRKESNIKQTFRNKKTSLEFLQFYKNIIDQMLKIKEYLIITEFKKNIEYFYNEIINSSNLEEIYDLRTEIIFMSENIKQKFTSLKNKRQRILNMLNNQYITEDLLEELYKDFASENYNDWDNPFLINYANIWYNNERELDYRIINDKFSYINNIKNKIKAVLNNALDLNVSINYTMLAMLSIENKEKLTKKINEETRIRIYKKYFHDEAIYLKKITNWDNEVVKLNMLLDKIKIDDINRDFMTDIQRKIENIITSDYLVLLDDIEKIKNLKSETIKRKKIYQKEKSSITKSFGKFKMDLITFIRRNRKIIQEVEFLHKKHLKKDIQIEDKKYYGQIDNDKIFDTYSYYKETAKLSKQLAINLYQKIIITYYFNTYNNINIEEFNMLYQLYKNEHSGFSLEEYYSILSSEYQKYISKENFVLSSKVINIARRNIYSQIDDFLEYCNQINYKISPYLLEEYSKKEELDIISLYDLFEKILNGRNINNDKKVH
ncbi:MAG: DnaJ domain-containing protein [Bacilli bacterium]|nr:DnaJ domain-containing protein [Bacilli bacterium]